MAALARAQQLRNTIPAPMFVIKLYCLVSEPTWQEIVRWGASGSFFEIVDRIAFEAEVLPPMFKHESTKSFTRQVRAHGFTQSKMSDGYMAFWHPNFIREHPHLLSNIFREVTAVGSQRQRRRSSNEDQNAQRALASLLASPDAGHSPSSAIDTSDDDSTRQSYPAHHTHTPTVATTMPQLTLDPRTAPPHSFAPIPQATHGTHTAPIPQTTHGTHTAPIPQATHGTHTVPTPHPATHHHHHHHHQPPPTHPMSPTMVMCSGYTTTTISSTSATHARMAPTPASVPVLGSPSIPTTISMSMPTTFSMSIPTTMSIPTPMSVPMSTTMCIPTTTPLHSILAPIPTSNTRLPRHVPTSTPTSTDGSSSSIDCAPSHIDCAPLPINCSSSHMDTLPISCSPSHIESSPSTTPPPLSAESNFPANGLSPVKPTPPSPMWMATHHHHQTMMAAQQMAVDQDFLKDLFSDGWLPEADTSP